MINFSKKTSYPTRRTEKSVCRSAEDERRRAIAESALSNTNVTDCRREQSRVARDLLLFTVIYFYAEQNFPPSVVIHRRGKRINTRNYSIAVHYCPFIIRANARLPTNDHRYIARNHCYVRQLGVNNMRYDREIRFYASLAENDSFVLLHHHFCDCCLNNADHLVVTFHREAPCLL